jgi:hypothetical protein
MNANETTAGVLRVTEAAEEKEGKRERVSLGQALLMLPGAILGITIAAFPLSLPVLYVAAMLFM